MVSSVAGTRGRRSRRAIQNMHAGHNGQMKARNHQHVKRAGALKSHAQRVREIGAVAGHHRGQHDGIVFAEPQRRRQAAHGRGQRQQPRRGGVLPSAHAASASKRPAPTPSRSTRSDAHRCRRSDALVEQIIRRGSRRPDRDRSPAAAAEPRRERARRNGMAAPSARTSGQRTVSRTPPVTGICRVAVVGHHFERGDAQIDALRRRVALRPRQHSARSRCAPARHPRRFPRRCAASRQKARPGQERAPDAAPSPRTTRPATATAPPAEARRRAGARSAANAHSAAISASATRTRQGRSQSQCVTRFLPRTATPHETAAPHAGQRRLGCRECARCWPASLPCAKIAERDVAIQPIREVAELR